MEATRSQTADLFLLDDLDDDRRAGELPERDLEALRAVAGWTKAFVARPNEQLGRAGSVCPFVPGALERKTLWLAAEHVADRSAVDVVELVRRYEKLLLSAQPAAGDDAVYKSIVVVFADLAADRAKDVLDDVVQQLAASSYVDDGLVLGEFYDSNQGTAIYNAAFRPFTSPVPFLLMRLAVVGDWKFFLDDEDWFSRWAGRYGQSGAQALADELRRLPWRTRRD
jgi:hypothetical protein